MAINSLSFRGIENQRTPRYIAGSETTPSRTRSNNSPSSSISTRGDNFERTTSTPKRPTGQKKTKNNGYSPLARATAKILIPVTIFTGGYFIGKDAQRDEYMEAPYGIYMNAEQSFEQLSETTGLPLDVLLWANETDDAQAIPEKAIIPNAYDVTAEKRAELEEKIASRRTSNEDKAKYEKELEALNAKKEIQDEIATVYINDDGEALIIPNDYVSCEKVKEAFGIKDGVILKYNREKLSFTWGTDGPDGRGYKDYTGASVPKSGITIPASKLGK